MAKWRVIITDSESLTGVAPVCDQPDVHAMMQGEGPDAPYVYSECCPHPHIETYDENFADELAARLTEHDARVCG